MPAADAAARTAPPGPKPGQLVQPAESKREQLAAERLTFLEHASGPTRRIVLPPNVSLADFHANAAEYCGRFGKMILPGSFLVVIGEHNNCLAQYFVRMAIDGPGSSLTALDLIEMFRWQDDAPVVSTEPSSKDSWVSGYSALHGYFVKNLRTGSIPYKGLSGLDEAQQMAATLTRNRART